MTPGRVTVLVTLFLVVINTVSMLGLYLSGDMTTLPLGRWLIFLAISLIITYVFIKYFLEYFVLGKIRMIYKLIGDSKQGRSLRALDTREQETFDHVSEEVVQWAQKRDTEIESLKKLEDYRRSFVGNISHELKTPIFSIQGYLHTLLEGGVFDEDINIKYLKRAAINLERLQSIVEDLEAINQLQSGKVSLFIETFDIRELVEEVIEDLRFMADDSDIIVGVKSGSSKTFKVSADRERIRQVLQNLIGNAIKYMGKSGNIKVGFYNLDDKILVEVEDDGEGIQEAHLNHLFDRFYRVDAGRSRKHGGSGLGLSIVKHIMEAHNETVSVRSTLGEGSTFGFTLAKP